MATTSIWSVKGWLGKVVIYVENPEKTRNPVYVEQKEITEEEAQGLSDVIAYAVDEEKTRLKKQGKEIAEEVIVMQQYVSGVNCAPATARGEMMAVKNGTGKMGESWHFMGISLLRRENVRRRWRMRSV